MNNKLHKQYKCLSCGKVYLKLYPRQRNNRCEECAEKNKLETSKIYERKKRKTLKKIKNITETDIAPDVKISILKKMLIIENRKPIIRTIKTCIEALIKGGNT